MSVGLASIAPEGERAGKSRGFVAECLGYVTARCVAPGAEGVQRPVFALFAAREHELRAFTANLRCGRKARLRERHYLEFLKGAGYRYATQRFAEGSVLTVWLPAVVQAEGEPGERVSFVCLPPAGTPLRTPTARLAYLRPWLASRTTLPLPADPAWLKEMAGELELAGAFDTHKTEGLEGCGYEPPLSVHLSAARLERAFLEVTSRWNSQSVKGAA